MSVVLVTVEPAVRLVSLVSLTVSEGCITIIKACYRQTPETMQTLELLMHLLETMRDAKDTRGTESTMITLIDHLSETAKDTKIRHQGH